MQIREPTKKLRKWKKKIISKHIGIGPVGVDNWFFKGPADLYRGVTGAILGTVPNALLYFAVYETSTSKLEKYLPKGAVHVVSASMGTIVASIVFLRIP
jgi:solute carrier family 25 S-adenosylmethionine transporter 26